MTIEMLKIMKNENGYEDTDKYIGFFQLYYKKIYMTRERRQEQNIPNGYRSFLSVVKLLIYFVLSFCFSMFFTIRIKYFYNPKII